MGTLIQQCPITVFFKFCVLKISNKENNGHHRNYNRTFQTIISGVIILPDHSSNTQPVALTTTTTQPSYTTNTYQEKVINTSLQIFLWEAQPNKAIFDWFITLQDKSR